MDAIRRNFRRLRTDQSGATAIEYGLIVALIAVALVTGLRSLGGGAGGMWTNLAEDVEQHM